MTAYYNEIESFPCEVIRNNIHRGRLPDGFVDQRDIRHVNPTELVGYKQLHLFAGIGLAAYACRLAGMPDDFNILTGGFPCKNLAAPGDGAGIGTRDQPTAHSGLFWPMLDIIASLRPRWLILENSPNLRTRGGDIVLSELEAIGYTCRPHVVGAWAAGAPHERDRVWIVAHSERMGREARSGIAGDESGAQCGRLESREHGPVVVNAHGQQHGLNAPDEIQPGRDAVAAAGAHCVGVGLADADATGRGERRGAVAMGAQQFPAECRGDHRHEWPARPGEVQHAREATRVVLGERLWNHGNRLWTHPAAQLGEGAPAAEETPDAGTERNLGGAAHGPAGRLAGAPAAHRRDGLKALGNAWVPWCAAPILRWIYETEISS